MSQVELLPKEMGLSACSRSNEILEQYSHKSGIETLGVEYCAMVMKRFDVDEWKERALSD